MQRKRDFTLAELTVVMVIIGILATLAISQYIPSYERALGKEAKANLKLIAAAEKIYRMENIDQAYFGCQCLCSGAGGSCCDNTTDGCNYFLKLSLTPSKWTYETTAAGTGDDATFTAYADRVGSGGYLNCRYSIDQSQDEPVVVAGATCP